MLCSQQEKTTLLRRAVGSEKTDPLPKAHSLAREFTPESSIFMSCTHHSHQAPLPSLRMWEVSSEHIQMGEETIS